MGAAGCRIRRFATSVTPTYDAAGNMICDGIYNYTYDAWNRLLTVQRPGGTTPQTIATYRYDGLGRRIYKNVQNTGRSTPVLPRDNRGFDGEEYYYYDYQWRLLEVRVPTYDPATGNVTGDRTRQQFVWGSQYIDEAICMDVNTQTAGTGYGTCADAGSRRFFYCQDANYNVVALRESTHSGSPPNETITNTIVERVRVRPVRHGARGTRLGRRGRPRGRLRGRPESQVAGCEPAEQPGALLRVPARLGDDLGQRPQPGLHQPAGEVDAEGSG